LDNPYTIAYHQSGGLEHPLPGLFHDDKLALPLALRVTDGDGDVAPAKVFLVVDDDGPHPLVAANVGFVQSAGGAFAAALYKELADAVDKATDYQFPDGTGNLNPDFLNSDAFLADVNQAFIAASAAGRAVGGGGGTISRPTRPTCWD
jgi:hypothetical protein